MECTAGCCPSLMTPTQKAFHAMWTRFPARCLVSVTRHARTLRTLCRHWGGATILALAAILFSAGRLLADEPLVRVTFKDEAKQTRVVQGQILVEAQDGGLLVLGRDGQLWTVTPEQLQQRAATGEPFRPSNADELGESLKAEFGQSFEIVQTKHYVICSGAGKEYARWCGALFERLLRSFRSHWRTKKLELHAPEFPLVAIVFADQRRFAEFATKDADAATASAKGYFSVRTNRMVLYDLTAGSPKRRAGSVAEINRRLGTSLFNVATIVHEATHQIAFNSGLHTRYAANPLWLTEGMAMYFETPDLKSPTGWRTVGKVNPLRFRQFRDYAGKRRQADSLKTLIAGDDRFGNAKTAGDAYAESWALSYFLIKTRRKDYVEYLKRIAGKPRLIWDKPEQRLADFRATFGDDLDKLDRALIRYMQRLGR